jgi:hypothetical protein
MNVLSQILNSSPINLLTMSCKNHDLPEGLQGIIDVQTDLTMVNLTQISLCMLAIAWTMWCRDRQMQAQF